MTSTINFNQSQCKINQQNPLLEGLAANYQPRKSGFTIIEVVLVLAIAGLIFLMVFIALPALQRNQRDTQRKNDLSRAKSAIDRYKSNNKGEIPYSTTYATFMNNYLRVDGDEFLDPHGNLYYFSGDIGDDDRPILIVGYFRNVADRRISITAHRKCAENGSFADNPGSNNYAIQIGLEGGGVYCLDG